MTFTDLLTLFSPYFQIDNKIDEMTMSPILIFTSKDDGFIYKFIINRVDVIDYDATYGKHTSKEIDDMIRTLKSKIRDKKIDSIIDI